jgi:outer membrane protein assembly factor BamB
VTASKGLAAAVSAATGQMIAINQETGKIEWSDKLPSSPYGAATITGNIVFTTHLQRLPVRV